MRIIVPILFLFLTTRIVSQNAYEYHLKIKGVEDTIIFFGHHYGDKQYVIDTVSTNSKGEAVISGVKPLTGGIYLIVFPSMKNKYFELIINEPRFSLETDTADFTKNMRFKGSAENTTFYNDLNFVSNKRKEAEPLREKLKILDTQSEEAKQIKDQLAVINKEVENERLSIQQKNPELFYSKFLQALEEVKIPEAPLNPDGTKDSLFAYRFIRQHFFDNIDFSDERFLRTNLLYSKVKKYLDNYVPKIPDSINIAVDFVIEKAGADDEVFKFIVVSLLNDYANSKIMGMDAVYVHIVDTYYKTGKAYWLDETSKVKIISKSDRMKPTLIGKTAPSIILQDTSGYDIPLHSINKNFTIVVFWDVDCSHCKKEMPKLAEIYPAIKEKGGEVYAVYSQEEWDKWKNWLKEHKYPWLNVGNLKLKSPFQQLYDIEQTPVIFILDKDKKIIAKKIGVEQIIEILNNYSSIETQQNKP
ncbi:MAG: redoxin domain-containing protein [Chitinophagales bacterium]